MGVTQNIPRAWEVSDLKVKGVYSHLVYNYYLQSCINGTLSHYSLTNFSPGNLMLLIL